MERLMAKVWHMFIIVFYCTSVYAEGCQQVCQMGYLIWRQQHVDAAHLPVQLQLMNREKETRCRRQYERTAETVYRSVFSSSTQNWKIERNSLFFSSFNNPTQKTLIMACFLYFDCMLKSKLGMEKRVMD